MKFSCTLSANCGIAFEAAETKLWIDAVHNVLEPPFSPVSASLWEQMKISPAFAHPDAILYTHCHNDHCSPELTEEALKLWPGTPVWMPRPLLPGCHLMESEEETFRIGNLIIRALRLFHEGKEDRLEPSYAFLISEKNTPDDFVLITGDTEVGSPELAKKVESLAISCAICIFPWATMSAGRKILASSICPRNLILYHFPFAEDDAHGFRSMTEAMLRLHPELPPARLLWNPLQTEVIL